MQFIIDKNPILNEPEITVQYKIDDNEDVWVYVNGLLYYSEKDFDIFRNVITLREHDIDFEQDEIFVMYNRSR